MSEEAVKTKVNWIQLIGTIVAIIFSVGGVALWVNSNIVALRTDMENMKKADYKADLREFKTDMQKQLVDFKADQRERDKAQWDALARKAVSRK